MDLQSKDRIIFANKCLLSIRTVYFTCDSYNVVFWNVERYERQKYHFPTIDEVLRRPKFDADDIEVINSYSEKDEEKDKTYELPPEEPEDDESTIDAGDEETSSVNADA